MTPWLYGPPLAVTLFYFLRRLWRYLDDARRFKSLRIKNPRPSPFTKTKDTQ